VLALIILRHAKSDWGSDYGDDRRRPLARRGRKAAQRIGRLLAGADQVPDAAITSPADRAQATLGLVMAAAGWNCPVRSAEGLYGGGVTGLLAEVRAERIPTRVLLLVSHEPTCSEAVALLIGGGRIRFPTAAVARVDLEAERWEEVGPGVGALVWSVVPRLLGGRSS
jgi:phosphohistidine phosphatase